MLSSMLGHSFCMLFSYMLLILNCRSFSNSSSRLLAFSSFFPPKTHHFWQHGTTRHHQEQELVPQDPMRNGDRGKTSISTNSEYGISRYIWSRKPACSQRSVFARPRRGSSHAPRLQLRQKGEATDEFDLEYLDSATGLTPSLLRLGYGADAKFVCRYRH
jgi:hypothetical protein